MDKDNPQSLGHGDDIFKGSLKKKCLLRARHCSKCLININSFNPQNNFISRYFYYFHFTDKETEAQRG